MKDVIIRFLLLICLFHFPLAATENTDYLLKDLNGVVHRVSDHRGKWLVINFWATWCAPCLKEMPELELFYQNNRARAEVWGVTFEDSEIDKIRQFVAQLGVTYPILGHGQDPLTGFGQVTVLPTTFIIDQNGLFFHRFEGPITVQQIGDVISEN
jgi:thiol-disulfide isomerase/thioredoxin